MRNLDKLVLLGGGALLALALLLEVSSITRLNMAVSRAGDEAGKLVDRANKNTLPARAQDPKALSGRVFAAWDPPPPINAHPFGAADFYPNSPAPGGNPALPPRTPRGRPPAP